jgi:hypothetical protein
MPANVLKAMGRIFAEEIARVTKRAADIAGAELPQVATGCELRVSRRKCRTGFKRAAVRQSQGKNMAAWSSFSLFQLDARWSLLAN